MEGLEDNVEGLGYINKTEGVIIRKMVSTFSKLQIKKDCIGVIAPYRAQIEHLTDILQMFEGVEINTVDKFQGRENKIIILSFVRSGSIDEEVHSELLVQLSNLTF